MSWRGAVVIGAFVTLAGPPAAGREAAIDAGFRAGTPEILSMSALTFGPDDVLFIGDGKGGKIHAIDVGDAAPRGSNEPFVVLDVEGKIGALLGARADDIVVHDMAVHPMSQKIYVSVSRSRANWDSPWKIPNHIGDAQVLLRIDAEGNFSEVPLRDVRFQSASLTNPIDGAKTYRPGNVSKRADAITDLAFDDGTLYVAGLSNEEFASTMWRLAYPFGETTERTSLEVYHGSHGAYETNAPIRTFVLYSLNDQRHLLAAYLCTPLVTFELAGLKDGAHVKGRTVAEFGAGNYPLDMVAYEKDGERRILIANNNLPLMMVKAKDIESFEGAITEKPDGYLAGVTYEPRAGSGVQQLDRLNDEHVIVLRRQPSGQLVISAVPFRRF